MTTDKNQQQGYASVNGLNLYYEIHGSGEPMLRCTYAGGMTLCHADILLAETLLKIYSFRFPHLIEQCTDLGG
jgi:hypothetical protein